MKMAHVLSGTSGLKRNALDNKMRDQRVRNHTMMTVYMVLTQMWFSYKIIHK
jgi:hypothetical protein